MFSGKNWCDNGFSDWVPFVVVQIGGSIAGEKSGDTNLWIRLALSHQLGSEIQIQKTICLRLNYGVEGFWLRLLGWVLLWKKGIISFFGFLPWGPINFLEFYENFCPMFVIGFILGDVF